MNIGLDFGMTNSTICYFNIETQGLDSFKTSASGNDYIPTVISYDKRKNYAISIGEEAKLNITDENYDAYENFKLLLGKDFNKSIDGKTKTPNDAAKDYIKTLFSVFEGEDKKIKNVVMTVPEIWFKELSNRTARENIENIYSELGYSCKLISEPVAAAGYFCWAYEKNKKMNPDGNGYNGHIMVVDYGGGTLDVTLCHAHERTITVLERDGYGEDDKTKGRAGIAFDEAVVERILFKNKITLDKNSQDFIELRNEFEENKIKRTITITERLKEYYSDPEIGPASVADVVLFSLKYNGVKLNIYCADLAECFEEINKTELINSISKIHETLDMHGVEYSMAAQNKFRVLLVGGFSNFFPVEATVREFFDVQIDEKDKRFEQPFNETERALSIARGAALIAQEMIDVPDLCIHEIGFIGILVKAGQRQKEDVYIPVIYKESPLAKLSKPEFAKDDNGNEIKVSMGHPTGVMRIYIDYKTPDNKGRIPIEFNKTIKDLFPQDDKNEYSIGFSVNENHVPTIYIKNSKGVIAKDSLHKLFEKLSIFIVK